MSDDALGVFRPHKNAPARMELGDARSGICLEYVVSAKELRVFGWYDSMVGIQGGALSLDDLRALGVPIRGRALKGEP